MSHFLTFLINSGYRISANSFRGNYSFLEAGVRKVFKGGNYSKEETIFYQGVLTAETIQRWKVFKGGNYSRKYGKCPLLVFQNLDVTIFQATKNAKVSRKDLAIHMISQNLIAHIEMKFHQHCNKVISHDKRPQGQG